MNRPHNHPVTLDCYSRPPEECLPPRQGPRQHSCPNCDAVTPARVISCIFGQHTFEQE